MYEVPLSQPFPTTSTMALGRAFNACVKEVKAVLQQNFVEVSIYSSYLHEYSTYVALLYVGKKPFSDPQIIWGHFPLKGVKKCTGKSFALFGGQAFLKEFEGLNRADIALISKSTPTQQPLMLRNRNAST